MLFDICEPREDVREARFTEAEFAADLVKVLRGDAPPDYANPARFFANTHPTRGLKALLDVVLGRLSGAPSAGAVYRLHTNFGGGKTHGLIALVHAARSAHAIPNIEEFVLPSRLPQETVQVAAFDGVHADPVNGTPLPDGGRVYTPWGEMACALGGRQAYEKVRASDERRVAPGTAVLEEILPDGPVLVVMDELAPYLRKLTDSTERGPRQLAAFLQALIAAVSTRRQAVLVFTLALGAEEEAGDAYRKENELIAELVQEAFDELEDVAARTATILVPTEDDETPAILRRRLFERIDEAKAAKAVEAYRALWRDHADKLPDAGILDERVNAFLAGYPFHPELISTLREKTSSLSNFQRIRGMLRLMAHTVARLWNTRPRDASAIHTCHIDLSYQPIRDELTTRLQQNQLVPALNADVAAGPDDEPALAQRLDRETFSGMPPYASYVARTIFVHTLAYPETNTGIDPASLRYAILAPGLDPAFIDQALRAFREESAFLDDRPDVPLRFSSEPNLTQIIRRRERDVDPQDVRAHIRATVDEIFKGKVFRLVLYPGGPWDVADDAGDGHPYLVLLSYEAETVKAADPRIPEIAHRIYRTRGQQQDLRQNRNQLVFLVADKERLENVERQARRLLALRAIRHAPSFRDLPEYQQRRVEEMIGSSERDLAIAVQSAYRHLFYPSAVAMPGEEERIAHAEIPSPTSAVKPGDGQRAIVEQLRSLGKLRLAEDDPDKPAWVVQQTPLRKGPMSTLELRQEFRRNPAFPMLVGDEVFVKLVRKGIEDGTWIYREGDLIAAKDTPPPGKIGIDAQTQLMTAEYAREHKIWPREEAPPPPPPPPPTGEQPGVEPGSGPGIQPGPPEGAITEEGVLREALARAFEEARRRKWAKIAEIRIVPFEASDAMTIAGLAATVPGAEKRAQGRVDYETRAGATCSIEFEGGLVDFKPVREFLQHQLRTVADQHVDLTLTLVFEGGLPVDGKPSQDLIERLARAGAGAAQVRVIAEGEA